MENKAHNQLNPNVLWVTAIALCAMIAFQIGRGGQQPGSAALPFEGEALGEMVTSLGDYRIMTTDGGAEELLFVLNNRSEQLMVYKVGHQQQLELLTRAQLNDIFAQARGKLGGR